jgi:hypothetical protein
VFSSRAGAPALLVPSFAMLLPVQTSLPADCLLTGLCGGRPDQIGPSSGLIFVALGFVALGSWGLWAEWKARASLRRLEVLPERREVE